VDRPVLTPWPIDRPRDWTARVNRPFGPKEEEAVPRSIEWGQPFGSASRQAEVATRPGLEWCSAREAVLERTPQTVPDLFPIR